MQTAPLLTVVMATTDSLYSDLYRMAHGEVDVTSAQPAMGPDDYGGGGGGEYDDYEPPPPTTSGGGRSKERLSNLSFAQRRHELAWRLASHSRAVTHVAALTAAAATTELGTATAVSTKALVHARAAWASADEAQDALYFFHANLFPARKPPHDVWGALDTCLLRSWPDLPSDLKLTVDRYETSAERSWPAQEVSDRWQMAVRSKLLLGEVGWMRGAHHHRRPDDRQQDHHHHHQQQRHRQQVPTEPPPPSVPWKISVRGGVVRLTHGRAKTTVDASTGTTKTLYPLEAILTVLTPTTTTATAGSAGMGPHRTGDGSPPSALDAAEWTLFSVEVHAQAKTGQSNHQLDTTNGQRFNMHRLCALAMSREEARVRKMELQRRERQEQQQQQQGGKVQHGQQPQHVTTTTATSTSLAPARPLHALFQVAHHFALSWQLEILSAQAQALRKGLWGDPGGSGGGGGAGKASGSSGAGPSIVVTPVQFFENRSILGIVSISFWSVDDRYGPPDMGDLTCVDEDDDEEGDEEDDDGDAHGETTSRSTHKSSSDSVSTVSRSINNPSVTNQLTLSVRAELNVGIRVSLSGAESIMEFATVQPHVRSTIRELVEATSNPFGLSASEALLAATRLCAERKCHAMVAVLPKVLPEWISLRVERGSIAVAATIRYHTGATDGNGDRGTTQPSSPVVLFRLACDARTGSFVSTFSHSTPLLQYMACNDLRAASDITLLRLAGLAQLRRTAAAASRGAGAASFESGRAVRDAFEALGRSMNVLGQRTGVGGSWRDHDDMSASLRQRAVQLACVDVKVSIVTCCGMAALYGLAAVAIGVATGVQASPDMAGGRLEPQLNGQNLEPGLAFLAAPPLSLLVDQKVVESSLTTSDGDRVKSTFIEQELFGICCTVDDTKGLTLYGAEVKVKLDSPISIPVRTAFSLAAFVDDYATSTELGAAGSHGIGMNGSHEEMEPAAKRPKLNGSGDTADPPIDIKVEAGRFASMLSQTLEI